MNALRDCLHGLEPPSDQIPGARLAGGDLIYLSCDRRVILRLSQDEAAGLMKTPDCKQSESLLSTSQPQLAFVM